VIYATYLITIPPCREEEEKKVRDVKKCINTTNILISREVLWNCLVWHFGPQGEAGILTSAGTSLMDYKRGVPVAQPLGRSTGSVYVCVCDHLYFLKISHLVTFVLVLMTRFLSSQRLDVNDCLEHTNECINK
jgi:hypothetical protein